MQQRIDIRALEPASYEAMVALERSVASAGRDGRTRHLVKLRASFLNGCAYCIDMHSAEGVAKRAFPRRTCSALRRGRRRRSSATASVRLAIAARTTPCSALAKR
jgi:AhpD family alkylhydroperoxidase